jgi:hypothetical protein
MADQSFGTKQTNTGSTHSFEAAARKAEPAKSGAEQGRVKSAELEDSAQESVGRSAETMKDKTTEFVNVAKDAATQAADKLKGSVDGQKAAGAEYVGNFANTLRRAAREFDNELPIAGAYIRKAASHVEDVADTIKNGNYNDVLRGAQTFARRQPTAFLGLALLAGFGVVRLWKTSRSEFRLGTAGWREWPAQDTVNSAQASRSSNETSEYRFR